jgi:hypothetical protein
MAEKTAGVLNDLWEYDPRTNAWTQGPAFSGPARGSAVCFVLGSRVYIGTGTNSNRDLLRDFWWAEPAIPVTTGFGFRGRITRPDVRRPRSEDRSGSQRVAENK